MNHTNIRSLLLLSLSLWLVFFPIETQAQCVVNASNNDYTVAVEITSLTLLAPSDCQYGYNYNLEVGYEITYSGSNIPGSMWNLQGEISCGSQVLGFQLPTSTGSGSGIKVVSGVATTWSNAWRGASDCASATTESLGCGQFTLKIQGPDIPSQDIECGNLRLPIELVYFTARPQRAGEEVILKWQTASEENNDFFTIERSHDARQWTPMATVEGAGDSQVSINYSWVDKNPLNGNSYYRLRQTDFDGSTTLSDLAVVRLQEAQNSHTISVFPNPAKDYTIVLSEQESLGKLRLFNLIGQDVSQQVAVQNLGDNQLQLNLSSLPKGTYILQAAGKASRLEKL